MLSFAERTKKSAAFLLLALVSLIVVLRFTQAHSAVPVPLPTPLVLKGQPTAVELEREAASNPTPENLLALTQRRLEARQFPRALEVANQLLKLRPDDPAALTAAAFAELGLGQANAAERLLQRAHDIAPANKATLDGMTQAARMRRDIEARIDLALKAVQRESGSAAQNGYYNIGLDYAALGEHQRSADAYRRASAADRGRCARCENNLGVSYMSLNRYADAAAAFGRAIALAADEQLYKNNLAWANNSIAEGRTKAAAASDTRARIKATQQRLRKSRLDPAERETAYFQLGLDYTSLGELEPSIAAYEKARISTGRGCARCENNLGVDFMQLRRFDAAVDAFKRAIALAPKDQLYRNNLAWAQNSGTAAAAASQP